MNRQISLDLPDVELDRVQGDALDRLVEEIIRDVGRGAFAQRLGVDETAVTHGKSGRQYRRIPARWVVVLAHMDRQGRIPAFFAKLAGLRVVTPEPMTDRERADLATKLLLDFGGPALEHARKHGLLP